MKRVALFLSFALLLTGCAGYQLGPVGGKVAGARSIQVEPVVNKTLEPRLSDALMVSMRKNLMQNGTYRLDTHDDGDIVLTCTVTAYDRTPLTVQPADVLTVLDYEIRITVRVVARERGSGLAERRAPSHSATDR